MKVILLADVKKVGRKNETVTVSDGYAQNVLLPKKLALPATPENLKHFQREEGRAADKKAHDRALLDKHLADLHGKTLHLDARTSEAGTLFQAIHAKQVAEAIEKEFGINVPDSVLHMEDIKQAGEHLITLSAGAEGRHAKLTLRVN